MAGELFYQGGTGSTGCQQWWISAWNRAEEQAGDAGIEVSQPSQGCWPYAQLHLIKIQLPFWKAWEKKGSPGGIPAGLQGFQCSLAWSNQADYTDGSPRDQRCLIQQLLMAQCHSSWGTGRRSRSCRLATAGLVQSGRWHHFTRDLSLWFPEEVFFQFFIYSSSLLLSIFQRTGGIFFSFFIVNRK